MDLVRRISKFFDKQAEEAARIVIITKNSSKEEIEKFENELKNKGKKSGYNEKTKINSKKTDKWDQIG